MNCVFVGLTESCGFGSHGCGTIAFGIEAFPWDSAPGYLLRDRDGSYRKKFHEATEWWGIREVLPAPQSPWQNAYVERLIGSIRRECLDHVIVLNEAGLGRVLKSYFDYYEHTRTHLSLGKDAPVSRPVQPTGMGRLSFPTSYSTLAYHLLPQSSASGLALEDEP
jgi:hypothetical protein